MKIFIFFSLLYSFSSFGRAPAVLPSYSTTPSDGGQTTEYIYVEGKSIPLKNVSFKSKGQKVTKYKIQKSKPISSSFAPIFLMFFALSIPFLAWVFISDEESIKIDSNKIHLSELEESKAEIFEIDFKRSKDPSEEETKDKVKKAS